MLEPHGYVLALVASRFPCCLHIDLSDNTVQLLTQTNSYREFTVIEKVVPHGYNQHISNFSTYPLTQPNFATRTTNIPKKLFTTAKCQSDKSYASLQMVLKKQINVWGKKDKDERRISEPFN